MGTDITFLPRNCPIYITVMHAHRGEISLTKIRTPSFDGLQLQVSVALFAKELFFPYKVYIYMLLLQMRHYYKYVKLLLVIANMYEPKMTILFTQGFDIILNFGP